MNAELNNYPVSHSGAKCSIGRIARALLITVPLVGLPILGLHYTDLNIDQEYFVHQLGCGCADGFNTNHLTMTVGFTAISLTLVAWWLASNGSPWKMRLGLFSGEFLALGVYFIRPFFYYNFWL